MIHEADLNILVSNVVSENVNKHCRLCLKEISEGYINFTDFVSFDEESFHPLRQILSELLGQQLLDDIPGVNVSCPDCLQKALECCKFIADTKKASEILNKTFNNLTEALSVDLDITDNSQRVYVVVGKEESVLILADKEGINKDILKQSPKILRSKKDTIYDIKRKRSKLTCVQCNYLATSQEELKEHKNELHSLNCLHCKKKFISEESLKQHIETEHAVYVCKECGRTFTDLEKLLFHEKRHETKSNARSGQTRKRKLEEPDPEPLVCKECGKTCLGLQKLKAHSKKHNTKSQCPKCQKVYLTKDFYLKHVELCLSEKLEVHPFRGKMEKKYRCDECDKGYSCPSGLTVHKKFVHGNSKGHICKVCGKVFTAPSYLKTHMVKHTGEKKFSCDLCTKSFVSKEALLYHTRRHTGDKPYSCNLCEERFVNASARAEHIKYKHQSPKFPCDVCGKKFFTTSFLKQHRQRHSDPSSKLFMGKSRIPPVNPERKSIHYSKAKPMQKMTLKAVIMESDIDAELDYGTIIIA